MVPELSMFYEGGGMKEELGGTGSTTELGGNLADFGKKTQHRS